MQENKVNTSYCRVNQKNHF